MQFREQGKKIQCIRSVYDPSAKRSHQTVAESFGRWTDKLPSAESLPKLTADEYQELSAWFASRQAAKAERTNSFRARYGGQQLVELATAITSNAGDLTADQAAAIWNGLAAVGKSLRRAGHPKPKRGKPVEAGTIDMLYHSEKDAGAN